MPSRKTHTTIGVVVGVGASIPVARARARRGPQVELKDLILIALALGAGGYVGSMAPDALEPSLVYGPNHRQVFHSVATGGAVVYSFRRLWDVVVKSDPRTLEGFATLFLAGFGIGYLSHLVADGTTPKGLPLLGKLLG